MRPPVEAVVPRERSLEVESDRPAELVARLFSLDATGDLSTEIELKQDGRAGEANGRYPFDLDADASAVVSDPPPRLERR